MTSNWHEIRLWPLSWTPSQGTASSVCSLGVPDCLHLTPFSLSLPLGLFQLQYPSADIFYSHFYFWLLSISINLYPCCPNLLHFLLLKRREGVLEEGQARMSKNHWRPSDHLPDAGTWVNPKTTSTERPQSQSWGPREVGT